VVQKYFVKFLKELQLTFGGSSRQKQGEGAIGSCLKLGYYAVAIPAEYRGFSPQYFNPWIVSSNIYFLM